MAVKSARSVSTKQGTQIVMVDQWRRVSKSCLICGSHLPHDVNLSETGARRRFSCPKCGDNIIEGVVVEDTASVEVPAPRDMERAIIVGDDTNHGRLEAWWADYGSVAAIHGQPVMGSYDLLHFVKKLYDLYENS